MTETQEKEFKTFFDPYECTLLLEEVTREELVELNKELPSDTYLARYSKDGEEFTSAFRAFKAADIFDPLNDAGFEVLELSFGFGSIRPNMFKGA
jgi:hypothetical protein